MTVFLQYLTIWKKNLLGSDRSTSLKQQQNRTKCTWIAILFLPPSNLPKRILLPSRESLLNEEIANLQQRLVQLQAQLEESIQNVQNVQQNEDFFESMEMEESDVIDCPDSFQDLPDQTAGIEDEEDIPSTIRKNAYLKHKYPDFAFGNDSENDD